MNHFDPRDLILLAKGAGVMVCSIQQGVGRPRLLISGWNVPLRSLSIVTQC